MSIAIITGAARVSYQIDRKLFKQHQSQFKNRKYQKHIKTALGFSLNDRPASRLADLR